jgi:sporulation protein YlmC with PRC-barrel domain
MRLSELRGKAIRSRDGKLLGRVHEVHCNGGKVIALMCGPASFVERWTAKTKGRRVAWEEVVRIESNALVVSQQGTGKRC